MSEQILLVISTFPDADLAARVAEKLVTAKLAACANITAPVRSIYPWEGKIEKSDETMVFFKTTQGRYGALEEKLRALHPYDVPEIVSLRLSDGLPDYLQWVERSCGPA